MNKYIAFYNGRQEVIEATSLWNATYDARIKLRIPKSKQGLLAVVLAEKDGQEVTHSTAEI